MNERQKRMRTIGIQRSERFSPNSVEKDLAILSAVVKPLGGTIISEEKLETLGNSVFDIIFSMGRLPETINWLEEKEQEGAIVINPPQGLRNCSRSNIERVEAAEGFPHPPAEGGHGYWLKRGDAAAETREDVVFCATKGELEVAKQSFLARGIKDMVVQAHTEGDLIKFYGVADTDFFRVYYPGDDEESKFGYEAKNGKPQHYFFRQAELVRVVNLLAKKLNVPVYGGDAIITAKGEFFLIDFNDWPSFSRCREEAAKAITAYALKMGQKEKENSRYGYSE